MSSLSPARSTVPEVRRAGPEPLSLALMDSRNQLLQLLGVWEDAVGQGVKVPAQPGLDLPQWLAGHAAWFAEYWIGRNPQRGLGSRCPADAPRLGAIEPMADRWYHPLLSPHAARWDLPLPQGPELRRWMMETLETTLELLDTAVPDDDGLFFFRAALFHEDLLAERLVRQAQALGLGLRIAVPPPAALREPVALPAMTWRLGLPPGGFAFDVERGEEDVPVPEFEIDAQPVSWSQYAEFVDDGGYDRDELWHVEGWRWLEHAAAAEGRRAPRHVDQIGGAGGAVLQSLFGKPTRMAGQQPAMHVTWWEADACARWMGRRLPTEVEWEVAAHRAAGHGFRWGEVLEWTAGTLRPYAGFEPHAWSRHTEFEAEPAFRRARVLRGSSFATHERLGHAKARRWADPGRDDSFTGFRTCAV